MRMSQTEQKDKEVQLLDGGMGHELKKRLFKLGHNGNNSTSGFDCDTSSFDNSCLACIENPDLVISLHLEYLGAGSQYITTNNFVLTPERVKGFKYTFEELVRASVNCAKIARDRFLDHGFNKNIKLETNKTKIDDCSDSDKNVIKILGSLPPLLNNCYINDGSQLTSKVEEINQERISIYEKIASCLLENGCDILICETMNNVDEAFSATRAIQNVLKSPKFTNWQNKDVSIWVSWTIKDDYTSRLRGGEDLVEATKNLLKSHFDSHQEKPEGKFFPISTILLNCSSPKSITHSIAYLIQALRNDTDKNPNDIVEFITNGNTNIEDCKEIKFGAYANAFKATTSCWLKETTEDINSSNPSEFAIDQTGECVMEPNIYYTNYVRKWLRLGCTYVGGCCATSPAHIQAIKEGK